MLLLFLASRSGIFCGTLSHVFLAVKILNSTSHCPFCGVNAIHDVFNLFL